MERIASSEPHDVDALVQGILQADAALAREAIQSIEDPANRFAVLSRNLTAGRRFSEFFPAPGRGNRPHDADHRRDGLNAAIEAGGFSNQQRQALTQLLDQNFRNAPAR